MIDLLRQNRQFFLPYAFLFVIVGILQILYSQEQLIRWVNAHNTIEVDYFFRNITYVGDGIFFVGMIALLFISSRRNGLLALGSFLLSSGLSIFLKQAVFHGRPRPATVFADSAWEYHIIDGLDIATINSFPSGHTISAFAVFSLLALLDERKARGWALLIPAVLVGYSRIYLFQHFTVDVFAGSFIGVLSSVGVWLGAKRWAHNAGSKEHRGESD